MHDYAMEESKTHTQNLHYPQAIPNAGSLHDLSEERDSCGVGFVAHQQGVRSHLILDYGLTSCGNVTHRGAVEADGKTGDGAGISAQVPHKILRPEVEKMGGSLDADADLGVGVFFLPQDADARMKAKVLSEGIVRSAGITVFGWREVPVDVSTLGNKARETMPAITHMLVGRGSGMEDSAYDRALYLCRREITNHARLDEGTAGLYIASFSHRMVSYKALCVATALRNFYDDLRNPDYETAICLYHQRFSTNTFPTWSLCQPFRMLAHNGEINTVKGNRNWMRSREADMANEIWGDKIDLLKPVVDGADSDSASLDGALELLVLSGRSVEHSMAMLVPPAWRIDPFTTPEAQAFYQYHRCFAEPWDGPAALCFTDGVTIAACLDRNGLRPLRYKVTTEGIITVGSEVGVVEIPDESVVSKGRLAPGRMLSVNTRSGQLRFDTEIKEALAAQQPYSQWLDDNRVELDAGELPAPAGDIDVLTLSQNQVAAGCTREEVDMILTPLARDGKEAIYSMGDDVPLSVLSLQPRSLTTYFKQLFAQVTNPPIDPIRERLVMSLGAGLGSEGNLLEELPSHARIINIESPVLFEHELEKVKSMDGFPSAVIDTTWPVAEGEAGLEVAIDRVCAEAEAAVVGGAVIVILSDRGVNHERVAVPPLMAMGSVHHHLINAKTRMHTSIVMDTSEGRDSHQLACLFAYGATAVCPYLSMQTIVEAVENDSTLAERKRQFTAISAVDALKNYRKGLENGLLKIMSKMGISVLNSYQGAQIFEAIGLGDAVIQKCFAGTHSKIDGVGFAELGAEAIMRHKSAFGEPVPDSGRLELGDPGYNRSRRDGERHSVHAQVIKNFHSFVRENDPEKYEEYVRQVKSVQPVALHDLFELVPLESGPVPLEEVEPVEEIFKRFTSAAMSLGAISPEAHETLAIAMNEIGAKSDSGEGGEDPERFKRRENGDWANSRIKQIASGRFGVTAEYLASADELEIKMAQGAKPGEGGQLPGHKVQGIIAKLRRTNPGVELISPPPHHDIYSIEDLAQLIHDLKEVNPRARICVKLVAESGVGTIAAGVAKANADIILVSGHEGGTGASPLSSIKHAGLPWEIGLAETQQVLMLNDLRDRVTLRTDGGLRTGVDIIHAAIIGAEEFNFGTIALIALGCVYVRQCHLNTCPVGIATQNPKLRGKFKGTKNNLVNYFHAVAGEVREIMAQLGVRKMDDLIGRTSFVKQRHVADHPKANMIDLSRVLRDVCEVAGEEFPRRRVHERNDGIHPAPLDDTILKDAEQNIRDLTPVSLSYQVKNTNRNVGTKVAGQVAYLHGDSGMPEGTLDLQFEGSAGQSFGTFLCGGIKLTLTGEGNDYVGKGMCGGEIIIKPRSIVKFDPAENSIVGNTCLYGATDGHLFVCGQAGERFCVRNSGATAVVEGIGDHGCEYMTNGKVVILGDIGKNFGAGMSGGAAYIWNRSGRFEKLYNPEMVEGVPLEDAAEIATLRVLIEAHQQKTGSARAAVLLNDWEAAVEQFIKVEPKNKLEPSVVEPGVVPEAVK
ncbi:MAG: glutamate synthase domain-containing protein 2/glutamate synthase domain-containing protein 1 [Verrucomicrobiales bacterium]|jgi:glutamate synthase domain-containing protein 2/glutamate synthase domain-containing protein 1/glutamate synthase domain-containing protein 3